MSAATATTTAALTARLSSLRAKSSQLSTELLTKLTSTSSTSRRQDNYIHPGSSSSSVQTVLGEGGAEAASTAGSSSLLHMASTISTIVPPQLSRLDQDLLRPLLKELEEFQQVQKIQLESIQGIHRELQHVVWKEQEIQLCSTVYHELHQVRDILHTNLPTHSTSSISISEEETMFRIVSLERASQMIHSLLQQVSFASKQVQQVTSSSSTQITTIHTLKQQQQLVRKSEASQFILKLAPTIRQVQEQVTHVLLQDLEYFLIQHGTAATTTTTTNTTATRPEEEEDKDIHANTQNTINKKNNLLILGHILRSLTLLQEATAAERVFVKTVTMPMIRSIFVVPTHSSSTSSSSSSMNTTSTTIMVSKLDQGGPRGECTGLSSLLHEILSTLKYQYGDVLMYVEDMFYGDVGMDNMADGINESLNPISKEEKENTMTTNTTILPDHYSTTTTTTSSTTPVVDLLTMGIWIPLATVLTADPTMKMAIFSPGIAQVLQANYTTLDTCITNLASSLLSSTSTTSFIATTSSSSSHQPCSTLDTKEDIENLQAFYYHPTYLTSASIQKAQQRISSHGTTVDFYKKFNLPIYYQLRFAELTSRVNTVLDRIRVEGWKTPMNVITATSTHTLQLPIFVEIQDCLVWMWSSQVYLKPMTHRFLRGVVQVLGRFIAFLMEGLDGKILFGTTKSNEDITGVSSSSNSDVSSSQDSSKLNIYSSNEGLYSWVDRIDDVAMVASDAAILHSWILDDYLQVIYRALSSASNNQTKGDESTDDNVKEMLSVCREVLLDASRDLDIVVKRSWDDIITDALIKKCVGPIAAVKGIAATFRMTNRPAPTLASPFVATILRSLKEFDSVNGTRVPQSIGRRWKERVLNSVADKYSTSVAELFETIQKTEEALKNRKGRKTATSGLSDGDKVKMQLYLDSQEFLRQVQQLNLDSSSSIEGLKVLVSLTEGGKVLFDKDPST